MDARVLFSQAMQRGDRIARRWNSPFVYEPLPTSTSIRVLRLLPEDTDGMIRCELTTVDLKQNPSPTFSCLSYTWGNPLPRGVGFTAHEDAQKTGEFGMQNRRPISCNGRLLYIGQNLHDAFKQLPVHPSNYVTDKDIRTPLHQSAEQGRAALVYWLLLEGAPVNALDAEGKSALHIAAENGRLEVANVLLKSGSDSRQLDYSGKTATDYARERGYAPIAELIINFTFDMRVALPSTNGRRAAAKERPQYLWVDAICINQDDIREKTQQVNMMDQIYKAADTTVIWLGREDHHTKTAVQFILKLYPILDKLQHTKIPTYQAMSLEGYMARGLPYIAQHEWDALASIYLRQWFQRVWVIQEVALAQNVVCFCGPHQIPWHFLRVTTVLDGLERFRRAGSFRYTPTDGSPWHVERNFVFMLDCRERRMADEMTPDARAAKGIRPVPGGRFQRSLAKLVMESWTLSSTDPRDKVFALLALSRGDPDSESMLADYALPVEQVYAQITRKMLLQPPGYHPLGGVGSQVGPLYTLSLVLHNDSRIKTLPSWVPDFSIPSINPLEAPAFRAAGSQSYAIEWAGSIPSASWNELSLRGCRLGTITGATTQRQVTGRATQYFFDATWFELLRTVRTPYPTGQPLSEVLWRTLCADQDVHGASPAPAALGGQFRDFVCTQLLVDAHIGGQDALSSRDAMFELLGLWSTNSIAGSGETSMYDTTLGITVDLGAGRISANTSYPAWFQTLIDSESGQSFIPTSSYVRDFGNHRAYPIWEPQQQAFLEPPPGKSGYFEAFGKSFGGRRMFKMAGENGGPDFLGISHRGLQLGDEVWAVAGSKVPFVLRKGEHGKHQLVGEAFVHGAMGGDRFGNGLTNVVLV